jgi:hypothetical protein
MASFAKLNSENIVEQVLSVHNNELLDNGVESETKGITFLKNLYGEDTNWKQTSYNTNAGVHSLGGTPFRKNHAGIGYTYDEQRDAFIAPKPNYSSWVLNENTCQWEAPVSYPQDGNIYGWNESTLSWDLVTK